MVFKEILYIHIAKETYMCRNIYEPYTSNSKKIIDETFCRTQSNTTHFRVKHDLLAMIIRLNCIPNGCFVLQSSRRLRLYV